LLPRVTLKNQMSKVGASQSVMRDNLYQYIV